MGGLNKPLSVRLGEEDAVFLAGLELDDATTSSDKVRSLIRLARQRAESPESFSAALAFSQDLLSGPRRALRTAEAEAGARSDVAAGLLAAVEDMLALTLSIPGEAADANPAQMVRIEAMLVDRSAAMAEMLLRWGVTAEAPAYDPAVVARRLAPLRELMNLVSAAPDAAK